MKFQTTLLAGAAVLLFSKPALALEDVSSSFYVPSETEILSETSLGYDRTGYKEHRTHKDFSLKEELQFGVGEEAAILFGLGNRFNTKHLTNRDYNNDLNLDYEIGGRKNFRTSNGIVAQLGASYYTYNPRSWYGRSPEAKAKIKQAHGNTRWYKELRGEAQVGYELEEDLMPYAALEISGNVDDSSRDLYYNTFAGVHKLEDGWSFDTGLRYAFDSNSNDNWYMQLASDYFLSDTAAVGGYADYRFAGSADPKVDYDYSLEARLKILF